MTKVLIDTRDKSSGTSANCSIDLRSGKLDAGRYRVYSLILPFYDYHVSSTNNQVYYTDSGGAQVATIPEGYYSGTTLASALKTIMDAESGPVYTVAYGESSKKLTFTPASGNLHFTFGTNTSNSAARLLGFDASDGSAAASQTGDNPVQLRRAEYLRLDLSGRTDINVITGKNRYFSTLIPIDTHESTVYLYGASVPAQFVEIGEDNIDEMKIRLEYPDGTLVNLRGYDFSIVLERC